MRDAHLRQLERDQSPEGQARWLRGRRKSGITDNWTLATYCGHLGARILIPELEITNNDKAQWVSIDTYGFGYWLSTLERAFPGRLRDAGLVLAGLLNDSELRAYVEKPCSTTRPIGFTVARWRVSTWMDELEG